MKAKELIKIIEEVGKQRQHIHIIYSVDEKHRINGFKAYSGLPYLLNGRVLDMSHGYSYMKAKEMTSEDTAIIDMESLIRTAEGETYTDWREFGNVGGNL